MDSYTMSTSPVHMHVSIPSVTEIHRGAARVRPFIHARMRAIIRERRETRTRDDATRRSIEPIVRSFASIRSHRFVRLAASRISRTRSRRPIADSPLGPSRRARESSIEGSSIVGSRSRARGRRRVARVSGVDGTSGFSFVHSFARATWARRRQRRRRRRDDATRSNDARRRGVGEGLDRRTRVWVI